MSPSAFSSLSITDLARVTGGADMEGGGPDPSQAGGDATASQAAPAAQGSNMFGDAFATLIQNAAAGFGASFGGQLGTMAAQLIGRMLPNATAA